MRGRTATGQGEQDIAQHQLVGGEVGDNVACGPETADTDFRPVRFRTILNTSDHDEMPVFHRRSWFHMTVPSGPDQPLT